MSAVGDRLDRAREAHEASRGELVAMVTVLLHMGELQGELVGRAQNYLAAADEHSAALLAYAAELHERRRGEAAS